MNVGAAAALRRQLGYAALAAVAGAMAGSLFGDPAFGAALALALYLARQLFYLAILRAWTDHPKQVELPEPRGIWGEIYERLLDLQRSNRKRKKRLAAMLAQFQASAEALPDGAVVLETRGEIVWFNGAAQALLNLRRPQDLGQRIANLLRHPGFSEYFALGSFDGEIEVPSPVNSAITLSLRVIPYGAGQRLLLIRDVSDLHRLERIRRDFVANASHELRTPLTVLRGYLDMLQPETRDGGALREWRAPINEMHTQAARMDALIKDLLKLASLEGDVTQSRQELIDVPALAERLLGEANARSAGQHRFEAEIDPRLQLYGRALEIESVFVNLLENAMQYTPAGGTIRVSWQADGEGAAFAVSDTGIGIAPDDIPRLTERFYRVDAARSRAKGGTGLGLSIVKHALERHESFLEIKSRLDKGSRFICRFPRHRVQPRQAIAANG